MVARRDILGAEMLSISQAAFRFRRIKTRCAYLPVLSLLLLGFAPSAFGWGCKGHEVVALIAEKHLGDSAQAMVAKILSAAPIAPDLRRFCQDADLDAFADASTWADDVRALRPETADWHFIDIPRGVTEGDIARFCPPAASCITAAIAAQLAVLRDPQSPAKARGEALRFVIHFVADLHQPLHTTTNNDLGGNCLPVFFLGHDPQKTNAEREDYRPNLHGIWDTDIIEDFTKGQTPQQVADDLENKITPRQLSFWQSEQPDVVAWAWEGHQLAEDIAYGRLPVTVPVETPQRTQTCADDDHVSTRMLKLDEKVGPNYEADATVATDELLNKAAIRLAAILNALWP